MTLPSSAFWVISVGFLIYRLVFLKIATDQRMVMTKKDSITSPCSACECQLLPVITGIRFTKF